MTQCLVIRLVVNGSQAITRSDIAAAAAAAVGVYYWNIGLLDTAAAGLGARLEY